MLRLLVLLGCACASALAADAYRDGWTPRALRDAAAACTESLVQGVWENTKREQGADPKRPLTPELRKQLAPQIDAFRALCDCTVRETAKRYGKRDWEQQGDAVARYGADLVRRGVCKGPPR